MNYEYFFSFTYSIKSNAGNGNTSGSLSCKINSYEQIQSIEKEISKTHGYDNCVIMNFKLLKSNRETNEDNKS